MSSLFGIGGGGNVGAAGGFYSYSIDQSLRLNGVDSNLARTHTAGDRQKFTWSGWVKYTNNKIFSCFEAFSDGTNFTQFVINTNGQPSCYHIASAVDYGGDTTFRLRDPSAWYHIVWRIDTTQASAGDRIRVYVNGELHETNPFTNFGSIPQNTSTYINTARAHRMGYNQNVGGGGAPTTQANAFGNGYLAEVHFCDGQSYAPTEFGETSNGIWVPITPSVTYGTNGFHLGFSDTSAIGDDTSGQGNDWTVDDIAAEDVVPDSPTNNFATWNPIGRMYGTAYSPTTSEGNLKAATAGNSTHVVGTFGIEPADTQGYYWEVKAISLDTSRSYLGILAPEGGASTASAGSYQFYKKFVLNMNGNLYGNNDVSSTNVVALTSWTTNDILMFAYKDGKFWIGKNGTWMNSGDPAAGTGDLVAQDGGRPSDRGDVTWFPYAGYNSTYTANFGQDGTFAGTETAGGNSDENGHGDFKYSVPSGFLALVSANLPEPAIGPNSTTTSDQHFNTVLYTGDGTNGQAITGVGHQPDFLWIKSRSGTAYHELHDSVRGAGTRLFSNDTAAESTVGTVSSFDSDGFTVSRNSVYDGTNQSGVSFVGWNWKAGGTAISNSDGSITSSVSANPDAGFSIVSWVGTGANATVGHGLSSAPDLVIVKNRSITSSWLVRHSSDNISNTPLLESTTSGIATNYWQTTQPTSSVFSVSSNSEVNGSGNNLIAYCFANVDGHLKCGKYVGNGSTDGTFIYTGFRPAFWMMKSISDATHWVIYDSARDPYNTVDLQLIANQNIAESDQSRPVDFLSNGVKIRFSSYLNDSGQTYIYLAFAEAGGPFKYSRAR